MGKTASVSALLILALLSETRGWAAPDFCRSYDCPEFTVVNKNDDFEERKYVETLWITINIKSISAHDVLAGFFKLVTFCNGNNIEGRTLSCKTWPALITTTQREEDDTKANVTISWFFPPGTVLPKSLDTSITEEVRPAGIVYVRSYRHMANPTTAVATGKELRRVLTLARKHFEDHRSMGAVYDHPWDILHVHHSEVWLNSAAQDKGS